MPDICSRPGDIYCFQGGRGVLKTGILVSCLRFLIRPVTVLLAGFAGTVNPNYGLLAASSLVATLPPVLLILAIQRRLVPGPTGGQGNKKSRGA